MTVRRSKLEIALSILSSVKDGEDKPTRIMYLSQMSWNSTQQTLASLVKQGLLQVIQIPGGKRSKKRYVITEKGVSTLNYFYASEDMLNVVKI